MKRRLAEPRHTRWTWVHANVLALLLLLLWLLGRGPTGAAACCGIPAMHAASAVAAAPASERGA